METAVSVCCLAIANSTENHSQIEPYISQPVFKESTDLFSLKCMGKFSDFERLSLIRPIQEMEETLFPQLFLVCSN